MVGRVVGLGVVLVVVVVVDVDVVVVDVVVGGTVARVAGRVTGTKAGLTLTGLLEVGRRRSGWKRGLTGRLVRGGGVCGGRSSVGKSQGLSLPVKLVVGL